MSGNGSFRAWVAHRTGASATKSFRSHGRIAARTLVARLRKAVNEADRVMRKLNAEALARTYSIQGFRVTGLQAVFHVAEHFSHHAGQIILLTKMLGGKDLKFTHLPEERKKKVNAGSIPAL